jgi:Xaa-Pro aminopeptidase
MSTDATSAGSDRSDTDPQGTDRGDLGAGTPKPGAEAGGHRYRPTSPAFREFIASGWRARPADQPTRSPAADPAAARRERVSARYPGQRLVVPAGVLRTRANDSDYRFRPHSAFAHLTGLGTDQEPDAVLVLEPTGESGHEAVLFFRPRAGRDTEEFYADSTYGELWVGVRPSLEEIAALTGMTCRHLQELDGALTKDIGGNGVPVRVLRGADSRVEDLLDRARRDAGCDLDDETRADGDLARDLSELRLVKDAWEIGQLRLACEKTARGFDDIARALPEAARSAKGERVIERAFEGRARVEGNGVGYDTIAAAGAHACTLHWIRNDGPAREGDLVLIDAGVEVDSLFTGDVTRTLPVSGTFTPVQRRVYEAVLEAADAAFAVIRPGAKFRDAHEAAMRVIASRLHDWGLLPGTVEESLDPEGQFHRRWMVHGTSHHLGLDVHDCAKARKELYLEGVLEPGMVFTVEPGLYFGPDDLLVPEELRGIGVRIEDDVLVTPDGGERLTGMIPRTVREVERWLAEARTARG